MPRPKLILKYVVLTCDNCQKQFKRLICQYRAKLRLEKKSGTYCSQKCFVEHKRKYIKPIKPKICILCNKKMEEKDYQLRGKDNSKYFSSCLLCRKQITEKKYRQTLERHKYFIEKWNASKDKIFEKDSYAYKRR